MIGACDEMYIAWGQVEMQSPAYSLTVTPRSWWSFCAVPLIAKYPANADPRESPILNSTGHDPSATELEMTLKKLTEQVQCLALEN
jgi:hypothetical protein